jgi:peroxiredoxin
MTPPNLLKPGDAFPALPVAVAGGDTVDLPSALAGRHAVVLIFRGAWCPYCNAQLRAFERARERLEELGVRIVALSVDDEATTRALVEKQGIGFPVGHGADAQAVRAATGAFVHADPEFLESTGFVLDPGGRVLVSVYSSNAIGRLVPDDVAGLIAYLRAQAPAAA